MSQYDPNLDPNRIPPSQPVYTETIETVVVRPESNTGWWIAGGLAAAVLIAVIWILASGGRDGDTEARLAEAEATAAQAQANADQAVIQGQINGAQQSVDFARADAARAQADAMRAASEARAAEARAANAQRPVIITTPAPAPSAPPVVTSTSPQSQN